MNYRNNSYGNGGYQGQRRPRFQNNGQRQGGNVQQTYRPNTGKAKQNEQQRNERDPAFTGVGNVICPDGSKMTIFISVWENQDGTLGFAFKDANAPQQQGNGQRQQRGNGGYNQRQQGRYQEQGGYDDGYQEPRQNGAMSRARQIPPVQYQNQYDDRNPPPADNYPDSGEYNVTYEDEGNREPPY